MSLYNMIHGTHPLAKPLLEVMGYTTAEAIAAIPRFRDVFIYPDEIRLLTRTGGGNREDYQVENESLRHREGFLRDWDDDYDSTFAWWAYKWPEDEDSQTILNVFLEATKQARPDLFPESLKEPTEAALERMGAPNSSKG